MEFERWAKPWRECARGVEEALNQADPTRSCERCGKLAAGLIILISFTLWITVELDSRGELPEIDELFSPGPGKCTPELSPLEIWEPWLIRRLFPIQHIGGQRYGCAQQGIRVQQIWVI